MGEVGVGDGGDSVGDGGDSVGDGGDSVGDGGGRDRGEVGIGGR